MTATLFIDTDLNRDMMATDIEKLLYDMVVLLKAQSQAEDDEDVSS